MSVERLLQEDAGRLTLEDGSGFVLLESSTAPPSGGGGDTGASDLGGGQSFPDIDLGESWSFG